MKKYFAFVLGNGSITSGIVDEAGAKAWAAKTLADKPNISLVHIAEVIEVAQRTTPTIEVKRFETDGHVPGIAKVA